MFVNTSQAKKKKNEPMKEWNNTEINLHSRNGQQGVTYIISKNKNGDPIVNKLIRRSFSDQIEMTFCIISFCK